MTTTTAPAVGISPLRVAFFATVVGVFIFDVFASQVLAGSIAADLGLATTQANLISTVTALGYALGLLLIVPLADLVENRRLVASMAAACAAALGFAGLTHSPVLFLIACFVSGAGSSLIQGARPAGRVSHAGRAPRARARERHERSDARHHALASTRQLGG